MIVSSIYTIVNNSTKVLEQVFEQRIPTYMSDMSDT